MIMGSSPSRDDDSDNMYSELEEEEDDVYERDYLSEMSVEDEEVACSDDDDVNPHETGLIEVIPTSVADLKDIASLTVAIALYKHADVPGAVKVAITKVVDELNYLDSRIYNSVVESANELSAPKPIVNHINTYVDKMRRQIKTWVQYNHRNVFFIDKGDIFGFNHIEHLVWYSNGTINSKATAKNLLLNSLRLSELEKYYLLCTYCMKDDFKRLSPLFRTHNVCDAVNPIDYPLICYWNSHFARIRSGKNAQPEPSSLHSFMLKQDNVDNWPAKEYFFDLLSPDEQVRDAIWLIDNHGSKYMKLVLRKLDEPQRLHVFMDKAVRIMTLYISSKSTFEEILSTWYEIRNLINKDEFLTVFGLLLNVDYDDAVLEAVWTSSCAEYKECFLNGSDQFAFIKKMLILWTSNYEKDFFFTLMRDASAKLRAIVAEKEFFKDACEKLICADELLLVDRLLRSCFTDAREITKFKEYLSQQDYFTDHYLSLVLANDPVKLEQLSNSFFPHPEDWEQFKQSVIKKDCFFRRLKTSLSSCEFPSVEQLLNLFPESEEMSKFKNNLVKDASFMNLSESLIVEDKRATLERILEIFLPQLQDKVKFKQELSARESVRKYFEKLMYGDKDKKLHDLLNWLLPNGEELAKFKRDFVVDSIAFKARCSRFYANGNLTSINMLLNQFMSPYPGLITEYKKNLVLSSMYTSVEFFEKSPMMFHKMVVERFLPIDAVTEIKKTIIFSPSAVEKMKTMIQEGRLDRVKERFAIFLTSDEDRKTLKAVVIGGTEDVMQMIPTFFAKHSASMWQSLMIWWLGNENLVREFKGTLPVDDLFNALLKDCVFDVYIEKSARFCKIKSNMVFTKLDRFLLWVFETSQAVKEYKIMRVDSYMNIDTIRMLLKKTDASYIKKVMQWFFENDPREVTKFENKNKESTYMNEMDDWSSDDDTIEGNDGDDDSDVELYSESEDSDNEKRKFPGDADFIPTRAPSLEKIASASIAIALCNHAKIIVTKFEQATTEERKPLFDEMYSWPSQLSLPNPLMEYVRNHFFDVLENLLIWLSNHRTEIFLKKDANEFDLPRVMHFIVWHPNGAINDLKTALNLLKSDLLGDLEKYRLACTYCLKEEIEKLWHTLVAKESPNVVGFPSQHPLVGYWNFYFADELHKVRKPGYLSIDEFMIRHENVFNWPATEYFFDRLSAEDQIDCVVHFIDEDYVVHQKLLLTKLNESQRLHVYIKRAIRIIRNYLHCGGVDINELDAVLTWYEVRDMFTKAQFWSLIKTLCRIRARDDVVMEIWTSSNDELRNHVLNFDRYNLINETLRWCIHKRDFGYGFFIIVLQNADQAPSKWADEQKKLFYEYYKRLLIDVLDIWNPEPEQCVKFRIFMDNTIFPGDLSKTLMTSHEFLKLDRFLNYMYPAGLPEYRQKARDLLLENFKYIDEYCMNFYSDGNVKGLNTALAPLRASFPELILEFKKNLLFSKQGIEVCYSHFDSTSDVLTEIVSDGFSDGKLAAEFGREIIFSNRGIDRLHNLIRDKSIPNAIAKRNVNLLLKSNEDVRKLKKCLLYPKQSLRASYSHFDSTTNVLTEIVSNGLPNSKAAVEFGRKIIFSNQGIRKLHNLIRDKSFPNEIVKKNVNLFLESNEDRRKLKTKLILSMPRDLNADTKAKKKYFRILSVLFCN